MSNSSRAASPPQATGQSSPGQECGKYLTYWATLYHLLENFGLSCKYIQEDLQTKGVPYLKLKGLFQKIISLSVLQKRTVFNFKPECLFNFPAWKYGSIIELFLLFPLSRLLSEGRKVMH